MSRFKKTFHKYRIYITYRTRARKLDNKAVVSEYVFDLVHLYNRRLPLFPKSVELLHCRCGGRNDGGTMVIEMY